MRALVRGRQESANSISKVAFMAAALVIVAALPVPVRADQPHATLNDVGSMPVNTMCPVMPDEPVDERFTIEYEGRLVGLCCKKCLAKFEATPTAFAANLPKPPLVTSDPETDPRASLKSDGHDHDHQHGSGAPKFIQWLGNFHPAASHIPIGLLLAAALSEIVLIFSKRSEFRHTAGFCIWIGTVGAVMAALLGWCNGGFSLVDLDWVQTTHRWLGTGTAAMSMMTLWLFIRSSGPRANTKTMLSYRLSLFLTTMLVATTGYFGGALVFGLDHYAW